MDTFSNAESSKKDVKDAGEQFFLKLYGSSSSKSLNEYRFLHTNEQSGEVLRVIPFSLRAFFPQVLQQSNIRIERITRYSNGWETFCHPQTGVDVSKRHADKLIFRLLLKVFSI